MDFAKKQRLIYKREVLEKFERRLYFHTLRELAHEGDAKRECYLIGHDGRICPDHLIKVFLSIRNHNMVITRVYMAPEIYEEFLKYHHKDFELISDYDDIQNGFVAKFKGEEIHISDEIPNREIYILVGIAESSTWDVLVNMGGVVKVQIFTSI